MLLTSPALTIHLNGEGHLVIRSREPDTPTPEGCTELLAVSDVTVRITPDEVVSADVVFFPSQMDLSILPENAHFWVADQDVSRQALIRATEWMNQQDPVRVTVKHGPGVQAIARERHRQVVIEGFDEAHDSDHDGGELMLAAEAYLHAAQHPETFDLKSDPPACWPWGHEWWKPSPDRIRNIEKAGALIAAEIDRLTRLQTAAVEPA